LEAAGVVFIEENESAGIVTRIRDDKGGSLGEYLLRFTKIRDSGERVIIDGNCLSACTLVTIIPKERICVTLGATLGFHGGWIDDNMGKRPTSAEGTRLLFELYPPTIRSWIDNHGGLGARVILLRGRELANLYPRCKIRLPAMGTIDCRGFPISCRPQWCLKPQG
jgi:hypothetical protein